MTTPCITTNSLTKSYGRIAAVSDMTLSIPQGHIVGLMGPNGSGKTTLLKILAGLITEYQGEVSILGHQPGPQSKALVSYLPDRDMLPRYYTVEQCLRLFHDFFADFNLDQAKEMCTAFGLHPKSKVSTVSKGMQEKLHLALVMSRAAKVYLLDEPMGGIDPLARDQILQATLDSCNDESTLIMSTHLIKDIEPVIDHVVFIHEGHLLLQGDADELRTEHACSIDTLFKEQYACLQH